MRVLIVDDNVVNRNLLCVILAAEGHKTVEAANGVEALETLRSGGFDAVISDILMPRMDGYRFCYEVRRSPDLQNIPVIIYSATYTSAADEHTALSVGADRLIRKPAPARVILEALAEETRHRGARKTPSPPAPEIDALKEYSEGLVRKLEYKNLELEASERRYRELVSLAPVGIYRVTREGRFVSVNAALVRLLGYESAEEVLRLDLTKDVYFDPADRERAVAENERLGDQSSFDVRFKRRDGSPFWVSVHARAQRGESGAVEHYEGFVYDVDERKRADREMRKSEVRFRRLFDSNTIGIAVADLHGQTLEANDAYLHMLGYTREEMFEGKFRWDALTPPEHRARDHVAVEELQRTGVAQPWEKELIRKDGTRVPILIGVAMLEASEQSCIAYIVDLTDRRGAETELRRTEEQYRLLFESNPQPMWVFDEETFAFLAVNKAACRRYGFSREEFLGRTIRDIHPPEDVSALQHQIATEPDDYVEAGVWKHLKKDGTVIHVEITSNPLVFRGRAAQMVLAVDVTERRKLEEQFRQAQKMEAVGQLAGGVAHDFNNLLTAILGYSDLLAMEVGENSPLLESISEIRTAGERAAGLTRQLLAFSRKQILEPTVLDVNVLVKDLGKMLARLIGEDISLETVLEPAIGRVRADAGQVEQILMNLAVNARDAMPRGGKVTIETTNIELDASYAREHAMVQPGPYVMLAVTDTGTGMSTETKTRIFEPFFTTKEKGKGTGLGLSTVYGIVKQSGGYVWVYSEPGHGTTFKIYLPRVEDSVVGRPVGPPRTVARGTETLLLVEDEQSVRVLSRTILENNGYTVLEAGSPEEALELARRHGAPIHLLLTDLVMPGMSGTELASRLETVRPETKVLFMSGYTDDAVVRHGLLGKNRAFLQKPFTPGILAAKIRDVLDANG